MIIVLNIVYKNKQLIFIKKYKILFNIINHIYVN